MSKNSADFHLPDEILSVIPTDPFDQLDLARKITSMAVASRVSQLEAETTKLQQKIVVKDQMIAKLQDRVYELDRLFQESDSRLRLMVEENLQLAKERDTLALNGKKLTRDLLKLETFKRQLMQSLNDDSPAQTGDIETSDASITGSSSWKATKAMSNRLTNTPHIGPQPSLNTTVKVSSTGCSPRRFYIADSSAKVTSGAASPTNSRFEDQGFMPSWYPSSQQTSASNSPPHRHPSQGRIPQIDGKEFFRQARTRLSYEQFGSFLANIKELNAHRKSRQETLAKAEEIFGMENKDLYLSFQRLLNRNVQ